MPMLIGRVRRRRENWRALPPPVGNLLRSLATLDPATRRRWCCTRSATLRVSQRAVPLGITLDKVGKQSPERRQPLRTSQSTARATDCDQTPSTRVRAGAVPGR